jgi:hypothetical protein
MIRAGSMVQIELDRAEGPVRVATAKALRFQRAIRRMKSDRELHDREYLWTFSARGVGVGRVGDRLEPTSILD